MLTEDLKNALAAFYCMEYEDSAEEIIAALANPSCIGIANADIYDNFADVEDDDAYVGNAQVNLNANTLTIEYLLNGKVFASEHYDSEDELADVIRSSSYDGWYEYCMDTLKRLGVFDEDEDERGDE